jgi:CRP-like cAMP-binding protein
MDSETRLVSLLEELVAWTRFSARGDLKLMLEDVLADSKHLKAYELTDGTRTQTEIGKIVGLSQQAISSLWKRWRRLGVVRDGDKGKYVHLVSPADLGMIMPPLSENNPSSPKNHLDEEFAG